MDPRALPLVRHLPGAAPPAPPLVVEVDLTHGIATQAPADPLTALRRRHTPALADVVAGLRHAAEDPRVTAVVLLGGERVGAAAADEIGAGLDAVRAAGKATYAFAESYGELGEGTVAYGLAARCAEVWLQPSGQVGLTGLAATMMLARGVLERLGIEPQFGQRREFKTAADLFSAREITEANREMTTRLARSATDIVLDVVARTRGVEGDALLALVDRAPLSAADARDAGLVDRLGYRDELDDHLRTRHGAEAVRIYAHRYARRAAKRSPVDEIRRRRAPQVAVVAVHGQIVSGRGRSGGPGRDSVGSEGVVAALRSARESDRVRAVLLHVDSPGGSYVASDAVRREVLRLREEGTPVVASMGAVAASGGYFVAMGADRVLALPTTLTGSIGVLAGKFVVAGLTERVGLVREVVGTGENATMLSPDAGFTDAQRAQLEAWLDEVYEDFTRKAAADRGLEWEALERVARGRVWTGADALEHGLVDALGGREAALVELCGLAGIDRDAADVVAWPAVPLLERLKPAESSRAPAAAVAVGLPSGPEGWIGAVLSAAGLPAGALALPWPIELR